jgi:hypothetical protein
MKPTRRLSSPECSVRRRDSGTRRALQVERDRPPGPRSAGRNCVRREPWRAPISTNTSGWMRGSASRGRTLASTSTIAARHGGARDERAVAQQLPEGAATESQAALAALALLDPHHSCSSPTRRWYRLCTRREVVPQDGHAARGSIPPRELPSPGGHGFEVPNRLFATAA